MPATKSRDPVVPKSMAVHYQALIGLTDDFCARHLDRDYADLARRAAAALCRKRPRPVLSGTKAGWACGIVYALGQTNFLSDKSSAPFMTMQQVCAGFDISTSTGASKAKIVRDAIGIGMWDHRWMLPGQVASSPVVWMMQVNGIVADIRHLPRPVQHDAYERGLIPYIPADGPDGDGGTRDTILARYDQCRAIARRLQAEMAQQVWHAKVVPIALRLGLIDTDVDVDDVEFDDVVTAIDLALFAHGADGTTAAGHYVNAVLETLPELDQIVANSMRETVFSFFCVDGGHRGAGVNLIDMISGERFWVMDCGLEATAFTGAELAIRVFRPEDFWMTTGVATQMDKALWADLEGSSPILRNSLRKSELDQDFVAETLYRLVNE